MAGEFYEEELCDVAAEFRKQLIADGFTERQADLLVRDLSEPTTISASQARNHAGEVASLCRAAGAPWLAAGLVLSGRDIHDIKDLLRDGDALPVSTWAVRAAMKRGAA